MDVDEKRCTRCGRIGKRAFVHAIAADRERRWPYGPWECEWRAACDRRRHAREAATKAADKSAMTAHGITPVDLDAIQATNPE